MYSYTSAKKVFILHYMDSSRLTPTMHDDHEEQSKMKEVKKRGEDELKIEKEKKERMEKGGDDRGGGGGGGGGREGETR